MEEFSYTMGDNYSDIPMEIDDSIDSDVVENSNLVEDNQNFGIQDAEDSASSNNFITLSPIKHCCLSETIIIHDESSINLQNTSIMLNEQSFKPNLYETIIHDKTSIDPLNKAIILNEQSFETSNNLEIYEDDKFKNKKVNETYVENDSSLLIPIIQITPSTPKKNLVDSDIKIVTDQICSEVTDSCINPEVHSYVPDGNNEDLNSTITRPNTREITNNEICSDLLDSFIMPALSPTCETDDSDFILLDFETGEAANVESSVKTPEKVTKSQETEDIKSESSVCNIEKIKISPESTEAAAEMKSESSLSNIEELSEIKESPEPQETTAEVKSESPLSNIEKLSKIKDLNALVPSETKSDEEVVEENIEIIEISCDEIIETSDYKKYDSQEKINVIKKAESEMNDSSSSGGSRSFPDLVTFLKGGIPERPPRKVNKTTSLLAKMNQQNVFIAPEIAPLSKLNNPIMNVKEDQLNSIKFDLSVFSDSPAKSSNRGSVYKLFDPLYKSDENKDCPIVKEPSQEETEENMVLDEELNTLKLEINQLHQEKAALELECLQKDEVILKAQAECLKKEITYNEEIKVLEDKLNSMNEQYNNDEIKVLTEEIEDTKNSKIHLTDKINLQAKEIAELRKTQNEYIEVFNRMVTEGNEYKFEFRSTQQHLTNIEMAFSDVHSKYERTKEILRGYKSNEEVLMEKLDQSIIYAKKYEERYNSLKAHAKVQLDKANKELFSMKETHHSELSKLTTLIRRLEIKNGSIQQSLDQKSKECADLAALCDELTGSVSR